MFYTIKYKRAEVIQVFIHSLHIVGFFYIQKTYCNKQQFLITKYNHQLYFCPYCGTMQSWNKSLEAHLQHNGNTDK